MSPSYEVWRHVDGSGYVLRLHGDDVGGYLRLQVEERAPRHLGQMVWRRYQGDAATLRWLDEIRRGFRPEWSLERRHGPEEVARARRLLRARLARGLALAALILVAGGLAGDLCARPVA